MAGVYVDTSALGRVLLGEPGAEAVLEALDAIERRVASRLLRIELRRLGLRKSVLDDAGQLLRDVALVPLDEALLEAAETVGPPGVGTLDAIHLVTALALAETGDIDWMMTYDARLAEGARHHGLEVISPG